MTDSGKVLMFGYGSYGVGVESEKALAEGKGMSKCEGSKGTSAIEHAFTHLHLGLRGPKLCAATITVSIL